MERICRVVEFVLNLQETQEIAAENEVVEDSDGEDAMEDVEILQDQKLTTGLLLKTFQAALHGRIWKIISVQQEKSPTLMHTAHVQEKESLSSPQNEDLSTLSSIRMNSS